MDNWCQEMTPITCEEEFTEEFKSQEFIEDMPLSKIRLKQRQIYKHKIWTEVKMCSSESFQKGKSAWSVYLADLRMHAYIDEGAHCSVSASTVHLYCDCLCVPVSRECLKLCGHTREVIFLSFCSGLAFAPTWIHLHTETGQICQACQKPL